jgi:CheY-like chemotaxis protein
MTLELAPEAHHAWQPRSQVQLAEHQVRGIQAWNEIRRRREAAASVVGTSREARQDLAKDLEVLRRTHEALVARTESQWREDAPSLRTEAPRRAVVVHRQPWFRAKMSAGLADLGVQVVAELDNGADAVGVCVAEQPDLLFVEDSLPMVPGAEVIREVVALAPATLAAVQVGYEERIPELAAAGAAAVFRRQVPPLEVVRDLAQLLQMS